MSEKNALVFLTWEELLTSSWLSTVKMMRVLKINENLAFFFLQVTSQVCDQIIKHKLKE